MRRSNGHLAWGLTLFSAALCVASCSKESPPVPAAPPPPPAAPAAPVAAPSADAAAEGDAGPKKSKLAPAPTDGLSLAERLERRKASEAKLAAQLAAEEQQRLLAYDKTKVKLHDEVYSFIKKTRAELDKAKGKAAIEKVQEKQSKAIVAMGKKLQTIDPKGGNSNVVTDYDVMLNSLANDYPQGLLAEADGDKTLITEQRAELDKRSHKIEDWMKQVKSSGKPGAKAKK
ncbi:MAG TPA: hypothetical protein VIU64_07385 [Polyangia bacterium]